MPPMISRPLIRMSFLIVLAVMTSCGREESPRPAAGPLLDTEAHAVADEPQEALTPLPKTGPKVVFLGDSISAGLHLEAARAYPAVLARRLDRQGHPFQLVNAGISGDTTAAGLRRLPWLLKQEPKILVIQLGANDGLRGLSVDAIESNLMAMVRAAQEARVEVLLLGMRLPPSYGDAYARAFDEVYGRVAAATGCHYVPHFMEGVAGEPRYNLKDGIHPTARGHELLADRVASALRTLVPSATESVR